MSENLHEAQYNITKTSKLRTFYESNKFIIFSTIILLVVSLSIYTYYSSSQKKERLQLAEKYIKAKIHLENENKNQGVQLLKDIVFSNDQVYSTLSLFIILDEKLIEDYNEVYKLFNHLLENNDFDTEIKNLMLYKKALYSSNYVDEFKFLEETKIILNSEESVWKGHTMLLIGDFYFSKKEYIKAKDFYEKVFSLKNIQNDIINQAKSQLLFIANEL